LKGGRTPTVSAAKSSMEKAKSEERANAFFTFLFYMELN
jgi:hypothetical protein